VLAGTVPLVIGWTLVAAHPAAALAGAVSRAGAVSPAGAVQPGGPISSATTTSPGTATVPDTRTAGPGVTPRANAGPQAPTSNQALVQSQNWAGYAATSTSTKFTSISASWTQPAGTCGSATQYAAFWVGLDGYSSSTVEQTGTEVDCVGGRPSYYAWYEMYPGAAMNYSNKVSPGDVLTGTVSYSTKGFTVTLQDSTAGWTATTTAKVSGAQRSSAEVIAEAPCCTASGGILPLTNFGRVQFTGSTVNGTESLATLNPVEITMPDVTVSALSASGAFTVTYNGTGAGSGGGSSTGGSSGSGNSGGRQFRQRPGQQWWRR
jgi:hypothetical protein